MAPIMTLVDYQLVILRSYFMGHNFKRPLENYRIFRQSYNSLRDRRKLLNYVAR